MMGAQPCNRGQLANRKIVRQMRFDIVDYPVKTGRTQAAAHGHRGRAAVGILAKQMDNRCLGQPLDKEPATGTTAAQFISPSGKGVTNVAIDTSDRWPTHGPNFADDFRAPTLTPVTLESTDNKHP